MFNELDILDLVYQTLEDSENPAIEEVSFDCDNDSGEVILKTYADGDFQDWIISHGSIRKLTD